MTALAISVGVTLLLTIVGLSEGMMGDPSKNVTGGYYQIKGPPDTAEVNGRRRAARRLMVSWRPRIEVSPEGRLGPRDS